MEIKSLENTDFDTLFRAFCEAFAEYEMQLDSEELRAMLIRRGFDPALSFAAFDGEKIAAFTLNGTGIHNGLPTAYDTGTGTLKAYRGMGLATGIFEFSIPRLRRAGIVQYMLEVLQHNTGAVSVYRKLGFRTVREFNYFRQDTGAVDPGNKVPAVPCRISRFDVGESDPAPEFHDFTPSWQNSTESIARAAGGFIGLHAHTDGKLTGYCVFEPASGDITRLAVDKNFRRKGIATALLREVLRLNRHQTVKVINTDVRCDAITAFLAARNIAVSGRQFEMIREL